MAERSLGQWLTHLEALHPQSIDLGLDRVARVARELDLLPAPFPVLTVAGTNGKGSVVYTSDALLTAHGLACGRYTSPHLLHFNERITVAGVPVDDSAIVAAFEAIDAARAATTLTYFEFATLAALYVFRARSVDIAVLEVGLGGRLDAVNIVDARVAVITAIALDHQRWLGNSLDAIGREKAGVARSGIDVVLAERAYPRSVLETLESLGSRVQRAGEHWDWSLQSSTEPPTLSLTLPGSGARLEGLPVPPGLRAANVAAALAAASLIAPLPLQPLRLRAALDTLRVPARRELRRVQGRELVLDVAHNPAAMQALAAWLQAHPGGGAVYAALGVMADKDLPAMVQALGPAVTGALALALPGIDRARPAEEVWQVLDAMGIAVPQAEFTVEAVWSQLLAHSAPGDRIVVCGSFHTVAGIMAHLQQSFTTP